MSIFSLNGKISTTPNVKDLQKITHVNA